MIPGEIPPSGCSLIPGDFSCLPFSRNRTGPVGSAGISPGRIVTIFTQCLIFCGLTCFYFISKKVLLLSRGIGLFFCRFNARMPAPYISPAAKKFIPPAPIKQSFLCFFCLPGSIMKCIFPDTVCCLPESVEAFPLPVHGIFFLSLLSLLMSVIRTILRNLCCRFSAGGKSIFLRFRGICLRF